jgi:hypothetical protein
LHFVNNAAELRALEVLNHESRFEVFKKYFRKITFQTAGDYVDDDFKLIDSIKEEDCEKPVQRNSRF